MTSHALDASEHLDTRPGGRRGPAALRRKKQALGEKIRSHAAKRDGTREHAQWAADRDDAHARTDSVSLRDPTRAYRRFS